MSLLDRHNVSFSCADGVPALGDVSLRAAEGERLALLGAVITPHPAADL